jgi:dipeptidyl aminopeptidase/acylaminoacyl peptidase
VVSSETGDKYAFLFSQDTIKEKVYSLYLGAEGSTPAKIVDGYSQGIPVGWSPSEHGNIYFSEDATKLYFGTAESPEPEPKDTLLDEEKPKLDIWNWQDLKLQPQQKAELEKEKKRTYLAVWYLGLNRCVQLADLMIEQVSPIQKGNGDIALGADETPYLRSSGWTGKQSRDYYLIDLQSGIKREVITDKTYVRLSPQGKYVVWYEPADSSYYAKSTDVNVLDIVPLTKMVPISFFDEKNDKPMDSAPYGIAGWSQDDRFVYIYDRYDIWKIDPSGGRVPVCITKAFGRRNSTRLRYVQLDSELQYIPSNQPLLLSAFDERTMSQGFFSTDFSAVKDPELLVMDKFYFANIKKAKEADKILWSKQNVSIFPDLWTSDLKFENTRKMSEANAQQKDFIWPKVIMVDWNSFSGEELKGLLYLPENLDPNKKYPVIVYFYEKNSELIYRHQQPSPSHSTINKTLYCSNGYLVFVPDITYKTGYPGQSAYNAIVSGTQYLINNFPFVDKERIGLQGQSWGGYQTAYLITQTDMYAAAMAGAPVSNMTSAYGGIRWESGVSRMFQYEHQQSRIGGSLWDKPLHYIENSPLFYAPKVNTPLLMMHNDNDGAVPWYQGIEFFVALRRLNKPVWMLTYNDEPHNLKTTSWANRVDLSTRMFQFFNHYLKGKPMPAWMEKGVPAIEKGKNPGY